jgi:Peptidase family M28
VEDYRVRPLIVCFFLSALAAPAQNLQQLTALLRPNALKADVSFLASDALKGRATPSPGLDAAAEYIASEFRRAGLDPAGDNGYFQTAPYVNVTPVVEGIEFSVETSQGSVKARQESMALQQAAAADLNRRAVVIVSSTETAGLIPEQVRGKVLVIDTSQGSRVPAFNMGALTARLQPSLVVLLRSGAAGANASSRLYEAGASPAVAVLSIWDEAVRSALRAGKAGPVGATISAHIPPPTSVPVELRNVIGVLRGSDPILRDTYILVTAHYDHLGAAGSCRPAGDDRICNGANDDASGTASVIEIAEALSSLASRPKRSIVFMTFFGEEIGLVGSGYYAAHPVFPLSKTMADVNLEQLGRTDVDGGSSVGIVNVTGYDYSTLTGFIRSAGEATGVKVPKDEQRNTRYFALSDNRALADAGVPAHTLSVGYDFPDYHRPGDKWPKLDYENLANVDRTIALAVFQVADSLKAPEWNKDMPATERYIKAREASIKDSSGQDRPQ